MEGKGLKDRNISPGDCLNYGLRNVRFYPVQGSVFVIKFEPCKGALWKS